MSSDKVINIILDPRESEVDSQLPGKKPRIGTKGAMFGRDENRCDLVVDLPHVSRQHARVSYCDEIFYIEDLDSSDGTFLNDVHMDPNRRYSILEGDSINIGDVVYSFGPPPWWEEEMAPGNTPVEPTTSDQNRTNERIIPQANNGAEKADDDQQEKDPSETVVVEPNGALPTKIISGADDVLLATLLDSMNLKPDLVDGNSNEAIHFVSIVGQLLVISLDGIRKALLTHEKFRDQYLIPGTQVSRSHINPLYNPNIDLSNLVDVLFSQNSKAIADPVSAVREAVHDFFLHGVAVPTAIDNAIREIFETFDSEKLESRFNEIIHGAFVGPLKKAQFWKCYREEYERMHRSLDDRDNKYRRAVGIAYFESRNANRRNSIEKGTSNA